MNDTVRSILLALLVPAVSHADGGTLRLSQRQGGYRITVFTAPAPFRAGPVDVSVLVQDADTGEMIPQAGVFVHLAPVGNPSESIRYTATAEAATNKLFRAAVFELPEPGWYTVEVVVDGLRGPASVRFDVEAADSAPRWMAVWPWVGWPALVVALFGVHQFLVRRRSARAR